MDLLDSLADKFKLVNITTSERLETQDDNVTAVTVDADADVKKLNNAHLRVLDKVDALTDNYDKLNANVGVVESHIQTFKKDINGLTNGYDKPE